MISPYHRENVIAHKGVVDFYDLVRLLESNGKTIPHEVVHAIKKLCYVNGGRGHKSLLQDLKESVGSINRYIEFLEEVDYNPQDLSEEEIEKVIEEHEEEFTETSEELEEEAPESDFKLHPTLPCTRCYTRSGDSVHVAHERFGGKLKVWPSGVGTEEKDLLCLVDATTFRVNTATDIDSPHDLMYNELPEDFIGDK